MKKRLLILSLTMLTVCGFLPVNTAVAVENSDDVEERTTYLVRFDSNLTLEEIDEIRNYYFSKYLNLGMYHYQPRNTHTDIWEYKPGRPGGDVGQSELEKELEEEGRLDV